MPRIKKKIESHELASKVIVLLLKKFRYKKAMWFGQGHPDICGTNVKSESV